MLAKIVTVVALSATIVILMSFGWTKSQNAPNPSAVRALSTPPPRTRWEYKVLTPFEFVPAAERTALNSVEGPAQLVGTGLLLFGKALNGELPGLMEAAFNDLGAKGFELVHVSQEKDGVYIFKRPVIDS